MATRLFAVLLATLLASGCSSARGRLYTNITRPHSRDFNNTPVGTRSCSIRNYKIKEPFSGRDIYVEWSSGQIARAARDAGISKVYYSDIETFSLLSGIYRKRTLHIYGE